MLVAPASLIVAPCLLVPLSASPQFRKILRALGAEMPDKLSEQLFISIDADNSGEIDFQVAHPPSTGGRRRSAATLPLPAATGSRAPPSLCRAASRRLLVAAACPRAVVSRS